MDKTAKAPQMIKALLLPTLVNIIGAKDDAAKPNAALIIAWCSGAINVPAFSDANCKKTDNFMCLLQDTKQEA